MYYVCMRTSFMRCAKHVNFQGFVGFLHASAAARSDSTSAGDWDRVIKCRPGYLLCAVIVNQRQPPHHFEINGVFQIFRNKQQEHKIWEEFDESVEGYALSLILVGDQR